MSQLVQSNNPSKDALALASDEGYGGSLPLDDLKEDVTAIRNVQDQCDRTANIGVSPSSSDSLYSLESDKCLRKWNAVDLSKALLELQIGGTAKPLPKRSPILQHKSKLEGKKGTKANSWFKNTESGFLSPLKKFYAPKKEGDNFLKSFLTHKNVPKFSVTDPAENDQQKFSASYTVLQQLGAGGHSTVNLATVNGTSKKVVCKFINATNVWHWNDQKLPLEIEIMKQFTAKKQSSFIQLLDNFQLDEGRFVIVMEYLGSDWMDLYDYIELFGPVLESHSKSIFKKVLSAIEFMHENGYSHNDIKGSKVLRLDENVMIHGASRAIRLIDFGSAMRTQSDMVSSFYGTQKFSCPEAIVSKEYHLEHQEVWALGTLLYVLLFKMDPFANDQEIVDLDITKRILRLRNGSGDFSPILISDSACSLVTEMLRKEGNDRPKIKEIKKFAFLKA